MLLFNLVREMYLHVYSNCVRPRCPPMSIATDERSSIAGWEKLHMCQIIGYFHSSESAFHTLSLCSIKADRLLIVTHVKKALASSCLVWQLVHSHQLFRETFVILVEERQPIPFFNMRVCRHTVRAAASFLSN